MFCISHKAPPSLKLSPDPVPPRGRDREAFRGHARFAFSFMLFMSGCRSNRSDAVEMCVRLCGFKITCRFRVILSFRRVNCLLKNLYFDVSKNAL